MNAQRTGAARLRETRSPLTRQRSGPTRVRLAVALSILLVAQSGVALEQPSGEQDVRRALASFIDALNNLKWDAFRAWFAEEATLFNPEIPDVRDLGRIDGREAIERSFRLVFDSARRQASGPPYLHIVPRNVRVQMLVDVAVVTFEFDRDGGSMGRRTLVFRKQAEGWRIIHLHASNTTHK